MKGGDELAMFRRKIVSPRPKDEKDIKGTAYKVVEIVGTSETSWEEAATRALEVADESVMDLRIAEITKLDLTIGNGKVKTYRARLNVSFKYHPIIKKIKSRERPEEVF